MRRNQIFWGLVAIIAGTILLLNTLGFITNVFWPFFWASMLILVGIWFLVSPALFRSSAKAEKLDIPAAGVTSAEISFHHGAGRLEVQALELPGNLVSGTFGGGVEHSLSRDGGLLKLKLKAPEDLFIFPGPGTSPLNWNIGLAREVPLKLVFKTGASENEINLADLLVSAVRIETGASSSHITLPKRAGFTRLEAKAGAAALNINVPEGVAASIEVGGGLAGIDVDTTRFPRTDQGYRSPDYDSAANRVEIRIETGVSAATVR